MKNVFVKREPRIPFTKAGYQKVLEEKAQLLAQRPEAVEHLRKAREMGDLSENGYYKASRSRLSFLDARLRRVDRLIKLGVIVESSHSGKVDIGTTVTLTDGKQQYEYTIVGGYESDPAQHTISHISPLGAALMGKQAQDIVEVVSPKRKTHYTILTVT